MVSSPRRRRLVAPARRAAARAAAVLLAGLLLAAAAVAEAGEPAPGPPLDPRHRDWLEIVEPLISEAEREVFLGLAKDYQREAFIRRFWEARDPYPETARNELRESWEERAATARQRFGEIPGDERARMLLFNGVPDDVLHATCFDVLRPLEIWFYSRTERIRDSFSLVFVSLGGSSRGPFRLWYPSQGLWQLMVPQGGMPLSGEDAFRLIDEECIRSRDILAGLSGALDWGWVEENVQLFPDPGSEWLQTFLSFSTDLPAGVETFGADLDLSYPGRHQSRTIVQGLVSVPRTELTAAEGSRSFVLDGEVLRKGELFEHFRYRFNLLGGTAETAAPLVFQRALRPGIYTLVVKVEDLDQGAYYREEREIEVPSMTAGPPPAVAAAATDGGGESEAAAGAPRRRLAEANFTLGRGDHLVQLMAPPARLLTGRNRFEAFVSGPEVSKVEFELDGRKILAKNRPPYSVELNLGEAPRIHKLRAVALDGDGATLASDEILVNAGPHRFGVRLLEPAPGQFYIESLRAHAAVDVPEGETLDRVEIYLNEDLVATLYQAPFSQPVLLPEGRKTSYVRAVAYLADGNSTEDAVVINSPDHAAGSKLQVHFVELYTAVVDRKGRPVEGLTETDFQVLEDGVEQRVRRFEVVDESPIYAGVLLDTSSSMTEELEEAVEGALTFFESVLTPRDRAAVITFSEAPHLAVRFTNDRQVLEGGLVGLTAQGETALYDSLVYALYYFSGISGKRAIIVLSDGEDVGSRYNYEDVIDYAHRTGVSIYAIGLHLGSRQAEVRAKLQRLASETGGAAFFIDSAGGLERVYESIEADLRSQYLLAYQSTSGEGDDRFREVEVRVARPGLAAKTMRGYYP